MSGNWVARKLIEDPEYYAKTLARHHEITNNDPWKFASRKYSRQMSAAKNSRGLAWRLDRDKTIKMIVETKTCALSGRPITHQIGCPSGASIDRKDSRLGYTKRNIQIVTREVNSAKMAMSDAEFIQLCVDVAVYNGYIKNEHNTTS